MYYTICIIVFSGILPEVIWQYQALSAGVYVLGERFCWAPDMVQHMPILLSRQCRTAGWQSRSCQPPAMPVLRYVLVHDISRCAICAGASYMLSLCCDPSYVTPVHQSTTWLVARHTDVVTGVHEHLLCTGISPTACTVQRHIWRTGIYCHTSRCDSAYAGPFRFIGTSDAPAH
jgi:hypothetical protein